MRKWTCRNVFDCCGACRNGFADVLRAVAGEWKQVVRNDSGLRSAQRIVARYGVFCMDLF